MLVSIASLEFDIFGYVQINTLPDNTDGETRRRVNRVQTLDGGVAISDRGYAEGDRTLEFTWRAVSKEHNASVARIVKLYARVHVITPDGVYLAAPERFLPGVSECDLRLLVIEKLA